ncbi:MAG: 4Fe-4S dicluster domain-containing protein [Candidatus Schekmanbacteria bacterium]|nr:MAG: 4Fe-4S dicluster domain-containing protein [Candidatus Schekmanbacteria bacterium]
MKIKLKIRGKRDLDHYKKSGLQSLYPKKTKITVGLASCGLAAGASAIYDFLNKKIGGNSKFLLSHTGCIGMCHNEPFVEVQIPGKGKFFFNNVKEESAEKIIEHLQKGEIPPKAVMVTTEDESIASKERIKITKKGIRKIKDKVPKFQSNQLKIATRNCGIINPENIGEYIARGGYYSLLYVLQQKNPEKIIEEIEKSGLRGRGGAGFPTGRKWKIARDQKSRIKYIVRNADEGDPGAYMDRAILEGDPHSVIEGMIIAGYAIGAKKGYIYVRSEYPLACLRIVKAISDAKKAGLLGKSIMGKNFSFNIEIYQGAGAFVCGEETALIKSIEGSWGEPQGRPPYPAVEGLFGKPTVINNVETLSNIPVILSNGAKWFSSIGTKECPGTKVFSLVGDVKNVGLVEVPMGTKLRDIIYKIGGGVKKGERAKAVQTGGPSGGCIPEKLFNLPVDYTALYEAGSIMGSGGMVVMGSETCMVDVAKYFLAFLEDESCGKCVPCRVGIRKMREILEDITNGKGKRGDIELLKGLAENIKESSFCNFGATAPNPLLSTIKYFRDEYESHINRKKCPAGICANLITLSIDTKKCISCNKCKKACPVDAISGAMGWKYAIIEDKCIKCRACKDVCPVDAVIIR